MDLRVALAAERTLLAWVRTGLAMMGFGFVVARFGLSSSDVDAINLPAAARPVGGPSLWIGGALIGLGVGSNIGAAVRHVRQMRRFERLEPYRPSTWSMGVAFTLLSSVAGLATAWCLAAGGASERTVMRRISLRLLTIGILASMAVAPMAFGCPFCAGDASGVNNVRDGIFNSDFWYRAAATLAPFPVFAAVVAFIYFGPQHSGASGARDAQAEGELDLVSSDAPRRS